jgi:hypothetical protein
LSVFLWISSFLARGVLSEITDSRARIPDATAQVSAQAQVDRLVGSDIARQLQGKKASAAVKLIKAVKDTDDGSTRYVMLINALNLACSAGAVEPAVAASGRLELGYQVDGPKLDVDTLARLGSTVSKGNSSEDLVAAATYLADRFAGQDRWDMLGRLATIADDAAAGSPATDVLAAARAHFQALHELHGEFDRLRASRQSLAANPDDPAANRLLGLYTAVVAGQPQKGLWLLAKSNDALLKPLAAKDLSDPAAVDQQLSLADSWWDATTNQSDVMINALAMERASHWYGLAAAQLNGLDRIRAQKRIQSAGDDLAKLYRDDAIFRARAAAVAAAGRFSVESMPTTPFPQAEVTESMTLPATTRPCQLPKTLKVTGMLTFTAGTEIRDGTIDMGTKGHVLAEGELDHPIVFRDVVFSEDLNSTVVAKNAVFDHCVFQKGGVWYSYYSTKWKFDHCVIYNCKFPKLTGVDYGFQIHYCLFASMSFPDIVPSGKHKTTLREQWNKIDFSDFVDCVVPPSVFWCAESSNFDGCRFVPGKENRIDAPIELSAFVTRTIGPAPSTFWASDEDAKPKIQGSDALAPFQTTEYRGKVSIPELIAGNPIRR